MNYSNMSFAEFKNFCAAVTSLEPNAKFSVDKESNKLTWKSGTQPSDSAIETEMARLDTLYTNQFIICEYSIQKNVLLGRGGSAKVFKATKIDTYEDYVY